MEKQTKGRSKMVPRLAPQCAACGLVSDDPEELQQGGFAGNIVLGKYYCANKDACATRREANLILLRTLHTQAHTTESNIRYSVNIVAAHAANAEFATYEDALIYSHAARKIGGFYCASIVRISNVITLRADGIPATTTDEEAENA